MPHKRLARFTLLPELHLEKVWEEKGVCGFEARKVSAFEICPKCATPSKAIYDHRKITVRDQPIHGRLVKIRIWKRRFSCKPCGRPFTEPIRGISKGHRTTARYRRHLLWACENFSDLKRVKRHLSCSYGLIYKALYEQLELNLRKRKYPWPKCIGIDEHKFKRHPQGGFPIFATCIVDHSNRRIYELVEGRSRDELNADLRTVPGRENVKLVSMDLSTTYRSFVKEFFPNAQIVADKFHVVRLLHPAINKRRKEIAGDRRKNPIGRLLLKGSKKLTFFERNAINEWLNHHPSLRELYFYKEAIHRFYRTRGYNRAKQVLIRMLDSMGKSKLPEVRRLRKTLQRWSREILEYFRNPITNGRVEGFNGKAKLIKGSSHLVVGNNSKQLKGHNHL